mmetsp:Transcript_20690/g.57458  ORF Transcript_20690/g.57458 Transcript_20690/m.57458 type:complete len:338 (+) Transcript_20690:240-1253(+)
MMPFTLSPSSAMASINNTRAHKRNSCRSSSSSCNTRRQGAFCVYFATALTSFLLAVSLYRQQPRGDVFLHAPSMFPGTGTVAAAVATTLRASRSTSAGTARPTMMALTTGSSRTLIEVGGDGTSSCATSAYSNANTNANTNAVSEERENTCRYELDVTYIDGDYEQGLFILRRAATDTVEEKEKKQKHRLQGVTSASRSTSIPKKRGQLQRLLKRAKNTARNPIVVLVLAGNLASIAGVLPMGISGFLPAVGVVVGRRPGAAVAAVSTAFRRWDLLSKRGRVQARACGIVLSKIRGKLARWVSRLYKNRSRYSLLSDYAWYVPGNESGEKSIKAIGE